MRHWQRTILAVWFALCVVIAANAAAQMFITFAPQNRNDPAVARAELDGIERVRRTWSFGVFVCSGALVISAGIALKLAFSMSHNPPIQRSATAGAGAVE